jgi:signal transduction histidine kinase
MPRGVISLSVSIGGIAIGVGLAVNGWAGVLAGTGWAWTSWLLIAAAAVYVAVVGYASDELAPVALGATVFTLFAPGVMGAGVGGLVAVLGWAFYALFAVAAISLALRLADRRAGGWLVVLWLVSMAAAIARVIWRDPFRERRCRPYCGQNSLLVARHGEWVHIADVLLASVTVMVAVIAIRPVVASSVSLWRRASAIMVLSAVTLVAMRGAVEPRAQSIDGADRVVQAGATVLLAAALLCAAMPQLMAVVVKWRVRRLTQDLARIHDLASIREVLRTSTGDGSLLIEVIAQEGDFVQRPLPDACLTEVRRGPRTIALISHRAYRRERVRAALTPTLVLAIENEHLLRRAQAQLQELREARRRVVDRGDRERHRLERDLHDGAQQHLLVLGMGLASATTSAPAQDQEVLKVLAVHAAKALSELRSVGHTAALSVLDDMGLAESLTSLAEETATPLVLQFHATDKQQPSQSVNRVVYSVVRSILENPATSSATRVAVDVTFGDAVNLTICVEGATVPGSADIEDRIGALGGTWLRRDSADGTTCEASIPCE